MLRRLPVFAAALVLAACSRQPEAVRERVARAPHGGTAVALGDDYAVEFVLDPAAGRLDAYFLDDDLENFIRVAMPSFDLTASVGGEKRSLRFEPTANPATGETAGNTSCFSAQAGWLKTASSFDAVLPRLEVRGRPFQDTAFSFPQGTAHD